MAQEGDASHLHVDRIPSKRQERRSQEVWQHNLEDEIARMSGVAEIYNHIAMDTLFPGLVARPTGPFSDYADYNYQTLKVNVDLTRVIQIGFTFSDAKGNRPKGISTWRFNFFFDTGLDLYAQDCLDSLCHTRGLDLHRHQHQGILAQDFGEHMMGSGLILAEDVRWVTYCGTTGFDQRPPEDPSHGRAGEPPWVTFCGLYDFGHMLQLLTAQALPDEVNAFRESMDTFFPSRCDVAKHIHRLPQLNGDSDSRKRPFFRNAHHILEAFFRLPDSVRRIAFDPELEGEEQPEVVEPPQPPPPPPPLDKGGRGQPGKHREGERRHKARIGS